MKGKQINSYLAVLVITAFGSLATMMIVNLANAPLDENVRYANLDPFDLSVDLAI